MLSDGYETVVDDEGGVISTGEKQLLNFARAFLADPAILILDQATSSVDTHTEVLIQEAMAALGLQRTSFVIAHRLSTIRNAGCIVVMEDGRIVEQGDHSAFLGRGGAYPRLYKRPIHWCRDRCRMKDSSELGTRRAAGVASWSGDHHRWDAATWCGRGKGGWRTS